MKQYELASTPGSCLARARALVVTKIRNSAGLLACDEKQEIYDQGRPTEEPDVYIL